MVLGGDEYANLITSLNPTIWARYNEASGNLINYGSDGNSGAVTSATQGQTGQLGSQEAYDFDAIDDEVVFTNADIAGTVALTTQRWMYLINAATLGTGSAGQFFIWGGVNHILRFLSANRLQCVINTDGTDPTATSNTGQVDFLTSWALVFVDYDDGDILGNGRKIRLLRATAASATTLLTLATDTAGTGTIVAPAANLTIGSGNLDGLIDETVVSANLWSPAGAPADLTLCDDIRSVVFGV
jgi:hypothetical protein